MMPIWRPNDTTGPLPSWSFLQMLPTDLVVKGKPLLINFSNKNPGSWPSVGRCWRCFYQQQRDVDSFLVANLVVIMGGIVQIIRREYFAQHPWENTSPSSGVLNSVYTWLRRDMTPQVTQAICLAYWVQSLCEDVMIWFAKVVAHGGSLLVLQFVRKHLFLGVLNSVYTWLRHDMTPQVTQAICLT